MIFNISLQPYLQITEAKEARHSETNTQVSWLMSYSLFDLNVQEHPLLLYRGFNELGTQIML